VFDIQELLGGQVAPMGDAHGMNPGAMPAVATVHASPSLTDAEPGTARKPAVHPRVLKSNPVTFIVAALGLGILALLYGLNRI
jgi:hypothetical protein